MIDTSYTYRDLEADAEYLYAHLVALRTATSEEGLLHRFRALFIDGDSYPDPEIQLTVQRILSSSWADQEYLNIFNRCCYILINYWWLRRCWGMTSALVQLIDDAVAEPTPTHEIAALRNQLKRFVQSEKYALLRDCERVVNFIPPSSTSEVEVVGGLISQYPYLYPYYLREWDSGDSGQQMLKVLQHTREQEFETSLFNYIKTSRRENHGNHNGLISPAKKPTSLSPEKLQSAIWRFSGKVEGGYTYQDTAKQVLTNLERLPNHRAAKQSIGKYLVKSIQYTPHPTYGEHKFNYWLGKQLENSCFERDSSKPNHRLLIHSCRDLIEALLAPPSHNFENHTMFIDLVSNLEATFAAGFLLKIVLLCQTSVENLKAIREFVAARFADLFKYYESRTKEDLKWLIECLDNWLIASTVQFGRWNHSVWASLVSSPAK
jgi:hypothetical protein